MGTRHLVSVVYQNKVRIAQYGQFDGYPSCAGKQVLQFLHSYDLELFKQKLEKCKLVDIEKCNELRSNLTKGELSRKFPYFCYAGADILDAIQRTDELEYFLENEYSFGYDSLMCEWECVIDFDKNTFEVYNGFNNIPLNKEERFYNDKPYISNSGEIYYSIKLIKSYDLNQLPTVEKMLNDLEE